MNVSSETFAYPINHQPHGRLLTSKHSSMLFNNSPIAVKNKIRAIQTRKSRINLQSYYDHTDIRPLNLKSHIGISNSTTTLTNLSPEKLVERSKELRLGRISAARQNTRPSVLSTISTTNQTSLIWPSYNSQTGFAKQTHANSTIVSLTNLGQTVNKSSGSNIPDIPQRTTGIKTTKYQSSIEQENIFIPIDSSPNKSLLKKKVSIPKISYQKKPSLPLTNSQPMQTSSNDYLKQLNNNYIINICESEDENEENIPLTMDKEFQEYLQKAIVKCADWLIKYVIDKNYDNNDE